MTEQASVVFGIDGLPDTEGIISEDVLTDARNNLIEPSPTDETYTELDDSAGLPESKVSLDDYIERGKLARRDTDGGKWKLVYLAANVAKDWGQDSLGEWAAGVGIGSSTARQYRRMGIFYQFDEWLAFCDHHQNADGECAVYFSHFSQALVLPTPAIAYEWLTIVANAAHWSVDEAAFELQKWINLRGYQKRQQSKGKAKTKIELCKNLTVNRPELTNMNGEWYLTVRITDDESIIKALDPNLKSNKNVLLQLTLTKSV